MKDKDYLQKFMFQNAVTRGTIVHLEESYQTILAQHPYPAAIAELLGEALLAVCLLASSIKFSGRLSIQFQGKNNLRLLLVECNHDLHLRGLIQWQAEHSPDPAELLTELKQGMLVITITHEGSDHKNYQGMVAWEGESLAQALEGYFRNSEQLPTRIWLAVNDLQAAGLMLQAMPALKPQNAEKVENIDDENWEHVTHLASTIKKDELLTLENKELLHRLYWQEDLLLFPAERIIFQCTCSVERCENILLLVGHAEVDAAFGEKEIVEIICEFCRRPYIFDRVDAARIFKGGNNPELDNQLH
jgi:molecular chaperone Hsp33